MMSKQDFIALADKLKECNDGYVGFGEEQIEVLANFCASQSPRFNRKRWLNYIAGECGPDGGKINKS